MTMKMRLAFLGLALAVQGCTGTDALNGIRPQAGVPGGATQTTALAAPSGGGVAPQAQAPAAQGQTALAPATQPQSQSQVERAPVSAPQQQQPQQTQSAPQATQQAALPSGSSVQFAPVIGATPQALAALSRGLTSRAAARGLNITQGSAPYLMKGYFSAMADGSATSVIYVWDVMDGSGNRVHRIQGQEKAAGSSGDGWSSVNDATMEAIAAKTVDELANWISRRRG